MMLNCFAHGFGVCNDKVFTIQPEVVAEQTQSTQNKPTAKETNSLQNSSHGKTSKPSIIIDTITF